ncbi:hypothetical protein BVRB_004170 [Beta vulgaris subsp. vulgaris]|uniref:Wall-associated receptor kinase C-terminal domain-containing protein n=1 Tax=Beta vulgaris subsp. vulgaris TaxID=3555 RepID=A0A0J8B7V4_BETVV|nr:hypothetical protein BVRB_004170 [Beta vulgaris subsp. vulgaris]
MVGQCNGVVIEVPYNDEDMKDGRIIDMLESGVLLNWKAYNCTACLESKGQCGYDAMEKKEKVRESRDHNHIFSKKSIL